MFLIIKNTINKCYYKEIIQKIIYIKNKKNDFRFYKNIYA